MSIVSALKALDSYDSLRNISINKIFQYSTLISCLKRDILLAQPIDAVEPPEVLPPSITHFLADALEIPDIQKSWDVLREYLWQCTLVPLGVEEYGRAARRLLRMS
jgi:hypothetical protein